MFPFTFYISKIHKIKTTSSIEINFMALTHLIGLRKIIIASNKIYKENIMIIYKICILYINIQKIYIFTDYYSRGTCTG